jgi:hypothetical protein
MMPLGSILKMLGLKVPEETAKQIEAIIPQIPARVTQAVEIINETIRKADERLSALEEQQKVLREEMLRLLSVMQAVQFALQSTIGTKPMKGGDHGGGGNEGDLYRGAISPGGFLGSDITGR